MSSKAFEEESDEKDVPAATSFPLLDLPAELRNNVYARVVEGQPEAYLTKRTSNKLASRSALPRANRQIREEFLAVLYMTADVVTDVSNFNFAQVITFLNRLRDAELKALPSSVAQKGRQVIIRLQIPLHFPGSGNRNLNRWLNRIQHPTKKGVNVKMSYVVKGRMPESRLWLEDLRSRRDRLPTGKKRDEVVKIVDALRKV